MFGQLWVREERALAGSAAMSATTAGKKQEMTRLAASNKDRKYLFIVFSDLLESVGSLKRYGSMRSACGWLRRSGFRW